MHALICLDKEALHYATKRDRWMLGTGDQHVLEHQHPPEKFASQELSIRCLDHDCDELD